MDVEEVIIASGDACGVYNAENGNLIRNYRCPQFHPKTLTLIGDDFLCGAIKEAPALKMWTIGQKAFTKGDMLVPRVVTALAATHSGQFLFAGMGKELYVWKVTTGDLLAIIQRPYQEITCIKCSSDDSHVLIGGKDGHVYVWMLGELVDATLTCDAKKPRFLWAHHTNEVTDVHLTPLGGFARVATASLDMTCRLYELNSGMLITTICMDMPLTAVTMDILESFVFIGDELGAIHRINIFEALPMEIQGSDKKNSVVYFHTRRIVSLNMSADGTKLVSASEDSTILVLGMESLSVILTIPVDGQLTNAFIAMKPNALMNESVKPLFSICKLKRCMEHNEQKQLQEAHAQSRKISCMPHIPSELSYNPSAVRERASFDNLDEAAIKQENAFQQTVNGTSVAELTDMNNQMYSFMTCMAMDTHAENSDSEMNE